MEKKVNFFLAGFQKCATSWIYESLGEHPDVFVPDIDEPHFFTINYYKGIDWYNNLYSSYGGEKALGDTTPTYGKSAIAAERINKYNEDAKIIFSIRNPINRAFSHYWHEKKKKKIEFKFEEAVEYRGVGNHDLYENWIKTGFYDLYIEKYCKIFGKENVSVVLFDELKKNPKKFIKNIYSSIGVDTSYKPTILDKRINSAWHRLFGADQIKKKAVHLLTRPIKVFSDSMAEEIQDYLHVQSEYERGMDDETRARLQAIYRPHISALEDQLGRSLEDWT
jgi:hypothetical protein